MASLRARALCALLPLRGGKRLYSSPDRVRRRAGTAGPGAPSRRVGASVEVLGATGEGGWPVYELRPPGSHPKLRVLYLHGGAHINQILGWHWSFLTRLCLRAPATVRVPIFPLAPQGTAERLVPALAEEASRLMTGPGRVALAGDSSGGGLALAVAQELCRRGSPPHRLILNAPWVDLALENPEIAAFEPRDPMLARPGLREAGRLYAGGLDLADPRVSPLHGRMDGLPPTSVFCGTRDLLLPDVRELVRRARRAGVEVDYEEGEGLPHVYPLMPIPEGRAAREAIANTLAGWPTT